MRYLAGYVTVLAGFCTAAGGALAIANTDNLRIALVSLVIFTIATVVWFALRRMPPRPVVGPDSP